ncbi:hypothetical protein BRARA_D02658 [Brassica rapa]|uniref:Uncharacterized protein n=1 Tax=Brassica campestris TaxID=3711 RepID=A0A397ZXQ0_BRACM|nr:hypothetical protein BRARA_D02658 [Brassica rapa]
MDSKRKKIFINDLNKFINRKDFYKRVGRAWKRCYILYGPPVAAIANYLGFDLYDLQLGVIKDDSGLRRPISSVGNRSILLVEDIDSHSIDLGSSKDGLATGNEKKEGGLSLAMILNSLDGVWTSCGEERIIIYTTNHMDDIDARLIRPGRIDTKVYMGYCGYDAFKTLSENYLEIHDHALFSYVQSKLTEVQITPARVAEVFTRNYDVDSALTDLVKLLDEGENEGEDEEASI